MYLGIELHGILVNEKSVVNYNILRISFAIMLLIAFCFKSQTHTPQIPSIDLLARLITVKNKYYF